MTPVLLGLLGEVEGALELEAVGLQHNEQEWPRWPAVSVLGACVAPPRDLEQLGRTRRGLHRWL